MKKIIYIIILGLAFPFFLSSCLKEDNVSDPVVSGIKMYMTDISRQDSLITEVFAGEKIKILVISDADIVSVWPGGKRTIVKKKNTTIDSVDMFNHPVLSASDCYIDYGLVGARGVTTTVAEEGWYCYYTYSAAGDFDVTVVATNHGYEGPDLRRVVYDAGTLTVK